MGGGDPSTGLKRPEHEADHSPLFINVVKNEWSLTYPPVRVHGVVFRQ